MICPAQGCIKDSAAVNQLLDGDFASRSEVLKIAVGFGPRK
jgi:hypothetical protein